MATLHLTAGSRTVSFVQLGRGIDLAKIMQSLKVTAGKKVMTLPAPVINRLVALENSIPQAVVNTISKATRSLFLVLGRSWTAVERTILRWTATSC